MTEIRRFDEDQRQEINRMLEIYRTEVVPFWNITNDGFANDVFIDAVEDLSYPKNELPESQFDWIGIIFCAAAWIIFVLTIFLDAYYR